MTQQSATDDALAEAAEEVAAIPDDEALGTVRHMARNILQLEAHIFNLEKELEESKDALRDLSENKRPGQMARLGLASFKLDGGFSIETKPFCNCTLVKETKPEGIEWLRNNGAADIVKNEISVNFGKGEDAEATKLLKYLTGKLHLPATQDVKVHPQTLNAWVRAELAKGDKGATLPLRLFKLYAGVKAIIKRPDVSPAG